MARLPVVFHLWYHDGGVAIRSKGLAPVMVMHFVMNVLFVLSGMILQPS